MAAPLTGSPETTGETTGGTGEPPHTGAAGLPTIPDDPAELGTTALRELSRTLFARLRGLDEGTAEYSYVRNTLVELNMALVRFTAARFRSNAEPYEDIVQAGTIGLIKAINRFDPDQGVEFASFAIPTISGEIKRHFRDTSWAVHVPRRLQHLRLALTDGRARLEQRLGREPTVAELARHTGLEPDDVLEGLLAANAHTSSSLDYHAGDEESEGLLARTIGHEDRRLEMVENVQSLRPLIAGLPERDRRIVSMRFGAEMTQGEIGAELGLSQMHVSRLLARILGRLRRHLADDG